jgi:hypothetical protein
MDKPKTERQSLEDISEKMDRPIGIIAIQGKTQEQQIAVLCGLGFSSALIGALVGMKPATVRKRKSRTANGS